jgi:hypothetical protein
MRKYILGWYLLPLSSPLEEMRGKGYVSHASILR